MAFTVTHRLLLLTLLNALPCSLPAAQKKAKMTTAAAPTTPSDVQVRVQIGTDVLHLALNPEPSADNDLIMLTALTRVPYSPDLLQCLWQKASLVASCLLAHCTSPLPQSSADGDWKSKAKVFQEEITAHPQSKLRPDGEASVAAFNTAVSSLAERAVAGDPLAQAAVDAVTTYKKLTQFTQKGLRNALENEQQLAAPHTRHQLLTFAQSCFATGIIGLQTNSATALALKIYRTGLPNTPGRCDTPLARFVARIIQPSEPHPHCPIQLDYYLQITPRTADVASPDGTHETTRLNVPALFEAPSSSHPLFEELEPFLDSKNGRVKAYATTIMHAIQAGAFIGGGTTKSRTLPQELEAMIVRLLEYAPQQMHSDIHALKRCLHTKPTNSSQAGVQARLASLYRVYRLMRDENLSNHRHWIDTLAALERNPEEPDPAAVIAAAFLGHELLSNPTDYAYGNEILTTQRYPVAIALLDAATHAGHTAAHATTRRFLQQVAGKVPPQKLRIARFYDEKPGGILTPKTPDIVQATRAFFNLLAMNAQTAQAAVPDVTAASVISQPPASVLSDPPADTAIGASTIPPKAERNDKKIARQQREIVRELVKEQAAAIEGTGGKKKDATQTLQSQRKKTQSGSPVTPPSAPTSGTSTPASSGDRSTSADEIPGFYTLVVPEVPSPPHVPKPKVRSTGTATNTPPARQHRGAQVRPSTASTGTSYETCATDASTQTSPRHLPARETQTDTPLLAERGCDAEPPISLHEIGTNTDAENVSLRNPNHQLYNAAACGDTPRLLHILHTHRSEITQDWLSPFAGKNALHAAAGQCFLVGVTKLVAAGFSLEKRSRNGKTAYDIAYAEYKDNAPLLEALCPQNPAAEQPQQAAAMEESSQAYNPAEMGSPCSPIPHYPMSCVPYARPVMGMMYPPHAVVPGGIPMGMYPAPCMMPGMYGQGYVA